MRPKKTLEERFGKEKAAEMAAYLITNELIAKFMQIPFLSTFLGMLVQADEEDGYINFKYDITFLNYHNDFSLLMGVILKIEELGHETLISNMHGCQYCNIMFGGEYMYNGWTQTKALGQADTKIEAIYKAVVYFINWYNQKNNT